jgi:hypothetical protein
MGEGATHAQEITHQSFPTHLQSDAGCVRRLGFFMGIYYELYVLFWMCMCIQGYYIYIIYIYIFIYLFMLVYTYLSLPVSAYIYMII